MVKKEKEMFAVPIAPALAQRISNLGSEMQKVLIADMETAIKNRVDAFQKALTPPQAE